MRENPVHIFIVSTSPPREEHYLPVSEIPFLPTMCMFEMTAGRRKALKVASTNTFGKFPSHEKPPANIFHENPKISNVAPSHGATKQLYKGMFLDATAQPTPPANICEETHKRKFKSVGPILRKLRHQDARKSGSHFHCFDALREIMTCR